MVVLEELKKLVFIEPVNKGKKKEEKEEEMDVIKQLISLPSENCVNNLNQIVNLKEGNAVATIRIEEK